jgi:hypothetical protein
MCWPSRATAVTSATPTWPSAFAWATPFFNSGRPFLVFGSNSALKRTPFCGPLTLAVGRHWVEAPYRRSRSLLSFIERLRHAKPTPDALPSFTGGPQEGPSFRHGQALVLPRVRHSERAQARCALKGRAGSPAGAHAQAAVFASCRARGQGLEWFAWRHRGSSNPQRRPTLPSSGPPSAAAEVKR